MRQDDNEESCGVCRYFSAPPPPKHIGTEGHCRRLPPTWRLKGVIVGSVAEYEAESAHATTVAENWCGEFKKVKG